MSFPVVLVGAGGHGKVVLDILLDNGLDVKSFIDPSVDIFYDLRKRSDSNIDFNKIFLGMGLGGMKPNKLSDRLDLYSVYKSRGANFISIISNNAHISKKTMLGDAVFINNGAIINGPSKIGNLVIINTRAIIEHDVIIEDGAHVAPGAIILGNCHIGKNSMIGAGAVILPGNTVPENSLVPALTRYPTRL